MTDLKQHLQKWSAFHWSPDKPGDYVIRSNSEVSGIGVIAGRNYAAFNIAWAKGGSLAQTKTWHMSMVVSMVAAERFIKPESSMYWDIVTRTQPEFRKWYAGISAKTRKEFPILETLYVPA